MLKNTNQNFLFGALITQSSEKYGQEIDIKIGKLSVMKFELSDSSSETLIQAIIQQGYLE